MATSPRNNFNYPTSYRLGCGRLVELPAACSELGMKAPLVISDPGVAAQPWFVGVMDALRTHGLRAGVTIEVHGNPVEADVLAGVAAYRGGQHDGCVLIGGGSALDVGKCVALMVGHPGSVFDYEDVGDNWTHVDATKVAPMIAVPTTAGTGSEVGRAGVIVDVRDHTKKIIFHPSLLPPLVIADPETTFGLPPAITAATGIDAFVHSFEAFSAPAYHPMADGIALEGMRLVAENLPTCFVNGTDAHARTHMMMASTMGAAAFQKGLGLVHAIAHPLGAITGLHHGLANAILLPYCMLFNREVISDKLARLGRHLDLPNPSFDGVLAWVLGLRERLQIPHCLAGVAGMNESLCARLAPLALLDPSMSTNPRPASVLEVEGVLLAALSGTLGA